MPRIPRIIAPDHPHHITQRGNNKQFTFIEKNDYKRYLSWFEQYRSKYDLSVLAYCLMPNHIHAVIIPKNKESIGRACDVCQMRYAQYFNKKNKRTGHLWQGKYYSCILDEKHLYSVIRYVENNPVRANLVKNPEEWEWSSAKAHLNAGTSKITLFPVNMFIGVESWTTYLTETNDQITMDKIATHTLSGKPLGSKSFVRKLERLLDVSLETSPRGRPLINTQK